MPTYLNHDPVLQPEVSDRFGRGVDALVNAIRPTLGPVPCSVAIQHNGAPPELLDSGALIARRVIALPDRDQDVGAMFLRGMLWELYEEFGDGTATAAVLFQAVYSEAHKFIVAGGNATHLREALNCILKQLLAELNRMTCPLSLDEVARCQQLRQVAEAACPDRELAALMADIFDAIGAEGRLEIRSGYGRTAEIEYIEGCYWSGGLATQNALKQMTITAPAILFTDLAFESVDQLLPALTTIVQAGYRSLVIMGRSFSDVVLGFLNSNTRVDKFHLLPVIAPEQDLTTRMIAFDDMTRLAGGSAFVSEAGDTLTRFQIRDLGHAESAWATADSFGIVGGQGDPEKLDEHLNRLRAGLMDTLTVDKRDALQKRIGRLIEGAVTLWIGGLSDSEIAARKRNAECSARTLRAALRDGVLPGGGIALLQCGEWLQHYPFDHDDSTQRAAVHILGNALAAPIRALIANRGCDAGTVMGIIQQKSKEGIAFGFDAYSGQVVDRETLNLLDVAPVLYAALHRSVGGAALALTIDVIVHPKRRHASVDPT